LPSRTNTVTGQAPAKLNRNILDMGFNNKAKEPPPLPAGRPSGATNGQSNGHSNGHVPTPASNESAVVEMTAATFDEVVLRAERPVFVDFYAPFCKCKFSFPFGFRLKHMLISQQTARNSTPSTKSSPTATAARISQSRR
jgi:hypothetical protein